MAALKPVQPTVCNEKKVWTEICKIAMAVPTRKQLENAKIKAEKMQKVFKK